MDIVLPMAVVECARYVLAMPRGEIDAYNEPVFRQQLFDAVGDRPLIIDMTEVSFLDCAALGAILAAERRCRERGSALAVAALRPGAEQVFRLARAAGAVPLCPTIQEAVWCVVPLTDEEIASWF
jgi:anti-sigma B factor antagonist